MVRFSFAAVDFSLRAGRFFLRAGSFFLRAGSFFSSCRFVFSSCGFEPFLRTRNKAQLPSPYVVSCLDCIFFPLLKTAIS